MKKKPEKTPKRGDPIKCPHCDSWLCTTYGSPMSTCPLLYAKVMIQASQKRKNEPTRKR